MRSLLAPLRKAKDYKMSELHNIVGLDFSDPIPRTPRRDQRRDIAWKMWTVHISSLSFMTMVSPDNVKIAFPCPFGSSAALVVSGK